MEAALLFTSPAPLPRIPSQSCKTRNKSLPFSLSSRKNPHISSCSSDVIQVRPGPAPDTLLRGAEANDPASARARFEKMIRDTQDIICKAIETAETGGNKFTEDVWEKPSGAGGGITRVLEDGDVWDTAGVNVSVVYGKMPPEAYRAAKGTAHIHNAPGSPVPYFAAGISSVLHPKNPFVPTVHFNYRYFETEGVDDIPKQWWFGGGTDLTPSYIFEEDVKHFHRVQKCACDKFDPEFYPKFKKWCDDYFFIEHRGERRGLGGIFFDNLNRYDHDMLFAFVTECASSVLPAYIPILERRKDIPFTTEQKEWQGIRRGRYVEFNAFYDRGTTFGLKSGARVESVLISMPLSVRWQYHEKPPKEKTEEWKLLDACKNPKDWI